MQFDSGCSGCFAGLSCEIRIEILNLLQKKGRMGVMDIAKHFMVTQPTVTHHLQYLKEAGVLDSTKEGRKVFYFLHPKCKKSCKIF